jgi:hypothetical protein
MEPILPSLAISGRRRGRMTKVSQKNWTQMPDPADFDAAAVTDGGGGAGLSLVLARNQ